jgi:hypothetical protein
MVRLHSGLWRPLPTHELWVVGSDAPPSLGAQAGWDGDGPQRHVDTLTVRSRGSGLSPPLMSLG